MYKALVAIRCLDMLCKEAEAWGTSKYKRLAVYLKRWGQLQPQRGDKEGEFMVECEDEDCFLSSSCS
jgi:hypothetical protein